MDKTDKPSLQDSPERPPQTSEEEKRILSEQHVTSFPLLGIGSMRTEHQTSIFYTFHWTVRFKVTEMNTRKAAILLKILMFELLRRGLDFSGYIAVEFLVQYVSRGRHDPLEIRDEKDRQAVMLGNLILASIRGTWISLDERIKIPPVVGQEILETGWMPDKRTWNSWKQFYNVRQFIEILTVPLEEYNERVLGTERYTSYTKGYGNGGHISRIQKTPYSSEIDGESTERPPVDFSLTELDSYNRILLQMERLKAERREQQEEK